MEAPLGRADGAATPVGRPDRPVRNHDEVGECRGERDHRANQQGGNEGGPHPLATLTQPVQLTGAIGRVKRKIYILATDPARFTQFYDKVKNDPGWTVHTLPCTTFIQLEMPDELTAILLEPIP